MFLPHQVEQEAEAVTELQELQAQPPLLCTLPVVVEVEAVGHPQQTLRAVLAELVALTAEAAEAAETVTEQEQVALVVLGQMVL